MDILSTEEIMKFVDPWDSQRNEKNAVSISFAFIVDILIRNENINSKEHKTKKLFEIILPVD